MKHPLTSYASVVLGCFVCLTVACRDANAPEVHKINRLLMGTLVEITVVAAPGKAVVAANAAADEIKRIEDLTSFHKNSELNSINAKAGQGPVKANDELVSFLERVFEIAQETGGAFDPTVGPLSALWGFSSDNPHLPDSSEINKTVAKVGWERVKIDSVRQTILLPEKGMSLDLGAVGKGYALDKAAAILRSHSISSALVNVGGDIIALGEKQPGKPWRVGVQDPRNPRSIIAVVELRDGVIVTSGDYERCFFQDEKRYHHILDPKTGYPAEALQSVTLVASGGAMIQPLATAVFVMGPKRGLEFIESRPGIDALLIDSSGKIVMSSGAERIFQVK